MAWETGGQLVDRHGILDRPLPNLQIPKGATHNVTSQPLLSILLLVSVLLLLLVSLLLLLLLLLLLFLVPYVPSPYVPGAPAPNRS